MSAIVVKVADNKDNPPTINQVGPDQEIHQLGLSNSVLIGPGNVSTMFLLLQGSHYSLAVTRESIKEKFYKADDNDDGYNAEVEDESTPNEVPTTLEEKLSEMKDKFAKLKEENKKMSNVIRKLKTKLAKTNILETSDAELNGDTTEMETIAKLKSKGFRKISPQSRAEINLKCPVCKNIYETESMLKTHMDTHNKDGDWTCNKCSYQTFTKQSLSSHEQFAHTAPVVPGFLPSSPQPIVESSHQQVASPPRPTHEGREGRCNHCNRDFVYRIDLTKHIRETHKTYKPCRNIKDCSYSPKCRYNHKEYPEGTQVCFECGYTSKTVHDLMRHRKGVHKVPLCKEFLINKCRFSSDDCYHAHGKTPSKKAAPKIAHIVENENNESTAKEVGFWDAPVNLAPPSMAQAIQQRPTQQEWQQMKETLRLLNQMMGRFQ